MRILSICMLTEEMLQRCYVHYQVDCCYTAHDSFALFASNAAVSSRHATHIALGKCMAENADNAFQMSFMRRNSQIVFDFPRFHMKAVASAQNCQFRANIPVSYANKATESQKNNY